MDLVWYVLGIATALLGVWVYKLINSSQGGWKVLLPVISGGLLLLFTAAWAVSSIFEGEPRSASMGILVFGVPALLLVVLGWRNISKIS
jgi:hypothetical protein